MQNEIGELYAAVHETAMSAQRLASTLGVDEGVGIETTSSGSNVSKAPSSILESYAMSIAAARRDLYAIERFITRVAGILLDGSYEDGPQPSPRMAVDGLKARDPRQARSFHEAARNLMDERKEPGRDQTSL
jgi:hypothetical protein